MERSASRALLALQLLAIVGVACAHVAPPTLVRDGAGLFSDDARQAAEARLQALADEYGVWVFVITEPNGDPPRMIRAPMAEADAKRVRAVALLFNESAAIGAGYSRLAFEVSDQSSLTPPDVHALLARGLRDEALDQTVDHVERWLANPPPADRPPPRVLEQPSAVPAP